MQEKLKQDLHKYKCEKITCGWEWIQRPTVVRDKNGIILDIVFSVPQNCSKCKSPTWDVSRH